MLRSYVFLCVPMVFEMILEGFGKIPRIFWDRFFAFFQKNSPGLWPKGVLDNKYLCFWVNPP